MLWNYLKISLRNLWRQRIFSVINILGLAIGIASCLLILLYVRDELSYDKFNNNYRQIYRVTVSGNFASTRFHLPDAPAPLGLVVRDEIPEVQTATRLLLGSNKLVSYENRHFTESRFYYTDSTFFDVFTFPIIKGDKDVQLNKPNTIVITHSTAEKYFGQEDPIGKEMILDNGYKYKVTGVCVDVPGNAHFHFDFLASLVTYDFYTRKHEGWLALAIPTYLVLKDGADPAVIEKEGFVRLIDKYVGPALEKTLKLTIEEFSQTGQEYHFHLQPLSDIHLRSKLDHEFEPNGDINFVYIFSLIAILVLIIAVINFMNLSTARSESRSREVGIRKMVGSHRLQLMYQFLAESILLASLALFIALTMVELTLPWFNIMAGKTLEINLFSHWYNVPVILGFALLVGVLAGSYPAFYLSAFQPIDILRSRHRKGNRKSWLRNLLVLSQFTITILLFIGTLVIYSQLYYINNLPKGFDDKDVLVVRRAYSLEKQKADFKRELLQNPSILSASYCMNIPGEVWFGSSFWPEGSDPKELHVLDMGYSDGDFIKTLSIELLSGRMFHPDSAGDTAIAALNMKAVEFLGLKDPVIGTRLVTAGEETYEGKMEWKVEVIGLIGNFHHQSLHKEISPVIILKQPMDKYFRYLLVKFKPGEKRKTLTYVEELWKSYQEHQPFEYFFLEDQLGTLYSNEKRTGRLFIVFAVLTIFIASLGLFGLTLFTAAQRTKEIGIRKVHGASVARIIFMLSLEFTRWVIVANLIAWPVAYIMAHNWLKTFAYHTEIPLWSFPLAALCSLLIAVATVTYQTIKSAKANPVDALRYE